jgi:Uma2 family endonuclease
MADAAEKAMTYEEFLAWADTQEETYEYVDGRPRPKWPVDPVTGMSGGTGFHHLIQLNVGQAVKARRTPPCRVAVEGRVQVADGTNRIPDVTLFCGVLGKKDRELPEPVLLVEVLSATSADYDRGAKLDAYKEVETVREVWLVDSERRRVTVWRRSGREESPWHADDYIGGAVFASGVLGGEVGLDEVYEDVEV